jgi:ankyrin repeat protein
VNLASAERLTPLWRACSSGHLQIVEMLLHHANIDVNAANLFQRTPLCTACINWNMDVVEALLRHPKIDVNLPDQVQVNAYLNGISMSMAIPFSISISLLMDSQ